MRTTMMMARKSTIKNTRKRPWRWLRKSNQEDKRMTTTMEMVRRNVCKRMTTTMVRKSATMNTRRQPQ
jgi:hypothetical protein